ncbi:IclR family transcriptional regulator [Bradyrhizobium sp. GCM10027634]|nr:MULTISPECIES: IclR family transcriptional regulator [Bradyrhizobium]MCG2629469.1 IclR family transcriptional regulator [Bradyrhizobium zhengyangense]MCG2644903.1 IclR family transcriptional regulator [Bradyrhizobium zhengyangense]MDN5002610.1 IclR family transcriptional regulator [Bradyrhizobium sp. WYCCWR 12677]GGI27321.1 IclR family transcriptional regulator [Bradyrhizobium guangdongense]
MSNNARTTERAFSGPRSALRVMDILQALAAEPEGLTLAKLSDRLKLPKTSVFSLMRALEGGGYARSDNGHYILGDQAIKLGASLAQARSFPKCARPVLERLARETEETILLGVLSEEGHEISYVDVIESEKPLRFAVRIGNRRPLYCTAAGKAMLAFLPENVQTAYLTQTKFVKFTDDTSSKEELVAMFPEIRHRGVVVDANGIIDGATGIASPCFDEAGLVSCSVTIAGPTARLLLAREHIERLTFKAAEQISQILGYRGPYPPAEDSAERADTGKRRKK